MDRDTILDILGSGGAELKALKENLDQLTGFLELVEVLDKLPEMDRRVSEDGISFYHAISKEKAITDLQRALSLFFGEPVKYAGESLPENLSDNLTIAHLGGIKEDQVLFIKRIGQGEMFGALFPWQRKVNVITVHLGLYNPVMPDEDYDKLENLVTETITQRVSEELEGSLAGKVQGISLPSFLQMSEMESSTCSLRISSGDNTGMLHLLNGSLIDAETDGLKHKDAAYAILSWDNPAIEILKAVGRTKDEIRLPLMHLLMDSLSQKDQREFEKDALPEKPPKKAPQKEKIERPEPAEDIPIEETAEIVREKIEAEAPLTEPALEMLNPNVGPDWIEIVPKKESPDQKPAVPLEAPPPEPEEKEPDADDAIDDALIKKEASLPSKDPVAHKQAPVLKPKKNIALVAGLLVLVVCVAGYFVFQGTMGTSGVSDYQQVMKKVGALRDADAQEKLLMDFINTHEPGEDTSKVEMKLQELWLQNEEANYQKAIDAVNKLPVDQRFEENAKAIYNRFLEKYPNTEHAQEIHRAVAEISGLTEDIIFSSLKGLGEKAYVAKIRAYENYLSLYPQGKYRDDVKQMFSSTLGDSFMNFKREIVQCERAATWDKCLAICNDYLSTFSAYLDTGEIQATQKRMQMEKDFVDVKTRAAAVDDDTARRLYQKYMTAYPDSANNETIQKEIQRMDADVTAGRRWASLKKSMQDPGMGLETKIDSIETYISRNDTSPYLTEARTMLKTLEKEAAKRSAAYEQSVKSLNAEEKAKKEAEEKYAALAALQAEGARIEREKQKAITSLKEAQGRFVLSGDSAVKDNRTGLMWSLLDSQRELGVCMDYRTAKRYVKELRHNGYDDWRLPTSAELAGIYKNKPYFPNTGADWYWTVEIFAKGYSYIVNIVSARQETVFKKLTRDVEACGSVRAVRP